MATATSRRRIAGDRTRQRREEHGEHETQGEHESTGEHEGQAQHNGQGEAHTVLDLDALESSPTEPVVRTEPPEPKPGPAQRAQPEVLSDDDPVEVAPAATRVSVTRRSRQSIVVAALALSLVAVLLACALALVTTRRDRSDVAAGSVALAAATKDAATILSYDYRHLPQDYAAATAVSTGSFRTDYQATTSKAVTPLATQTHAVVTAKVTTGGVVSSSSSRATILLFVDQTTTSNRLDAPKVDLNRVQLTLQKVGGRWLVSSLKAL
jgi:Mce-associated membrane protein